MNNKKIKSKKSEKKNKLHVGCGDVIIKGCINLDSIKQPGVDVVWDLNKFPYPFKDNEIDKDFTSHTLEHVNDLQKTIIELHRICKNGAKIKIRVPHFSCGVYYWDPTHKKPFSYFTYDYFSSDKQYARKEKGLFEIKYHKLNFTRLSQTWVNLFMNPLINLFPGIYERFFCWIIPPSEVLFILEVKK